jgi:hypothetical protein
VADANGYGRDAYRICDNFAQTARPGKKAGVDEFDFQKQFKI